jgi:SAM-dependent methyltransferase
MLEPIDKSLSNYVRLSEYLMMKIDYICPLCGSKKINVMYEGQDRLHNKEGRFIIVKCIDCGCIFTYPQLSWDEMSKYYPNSYLPYQSFSARLVDKFISKRGLETKRKIINKYKKSGSLLDIGCANGDFLRYLNKNSNWVLTGIEPNKNAISISKDLNINIINNTFENVSFSECSFDVVTMWHVFEHLSNPRESLNKIYKLLKSDGILILGIPNSESIDAKIFGKYWSGYDVPRHYFTYSKTLVKRLLQECGFITVNIFNFIGGFSAFKISMNFLLDDITIPSLIKKFTRSVIDSILFRILMFPYFLLVNYLGKGSTIVVVASKKPLPFGETKNAE